MKFQRFSITLVIVLFVVFGQSCKDMGDLPPAPTLIATTLSVTLLPGGQTTVTISGGNPPYAISRQPAASIASATLTNNANRSGTLTIQASNQNISGTTSVKVKDAEVHGANDSPDHGENEIEIAIQVSAAVVSFSAQVQPIFTNRCVNAGCHPGGGGPFSLAAGQSRGNMVNIQATSSCTSDRRVVPGDAAASVLYKKISGTSCGDRMPRNLPPLIASEADLIRDWINQGALNN